MIYALYGTDIMKVRSRSGALVKTMLTKKPDATYIRITPEQYTPGTLEELLGAQALFSQKVIVELDTLLSVPDINLGEQFSELKKSDNIFIILEEEIEADILKELEKHVEKIEQHDMSNGREERPNLFSLADALGARNKKTMWVEYQKAVANDMANEEIHGMLFWQVKNMILAFSSTEKDSGLKPFVYGKSKRYAANNYSKEGLAKLSHDLVHMYHHARRGGPDLGNSLERWVLSL